MRPPSSSSTDPTPPTQGEGSLPQGNRGLGARLASGIGALGVTFIGWSLLQLVAVPLFLAAWGKDTYAEWLTLVALAALAGSVDLGLQIHLTNRIRVHAARGEITALNQVIARGLALYAALIMAAFTLLLILVYGLDLTGALGLTETDASATALCLGATTLVLLPRGLIACVFSARGQMDREVWLGFLPLATPLATQMTMAAAGAGLTDSALAGLIAGAAAGWIPLLVALRRFHPDIRLRLRWPEADRRRAYLSRAAWHAIPNFSQIGAIHLPVLLLQTLAGSASGTMIVAFTTTRALTNLIRQVADQSAIPTALEMTRQHALNDRGNLRVLFGVATRLSGGIAGLLAGLLMVIGGPFYALWTHGALDFSWSLAIIFILGAAIAAPVGCALALLRHTDQAVPLAWSHGARIVLCVVMGMALIPLGGVIGAALAFILSEILALLLPMLLATHRIFGVPWWPLAPAGWVAAAGGGVLGAALALACTTFFPPLVGTLELGGLGVAWTLTTLPFLPILLLPSTQRRIFWHECRSRLAKICLDRA